MAKEIDIEKVLHPDSNVLKQDDEGNITATIVDAELDAFECQFNYDGCVELNTKGYNTISLSTENLFRLVELIEEAEKRYDAMPDPE